VRVLARDRGSVIVTDGDAEWAAPIAGRLEHAGETPITGDWVRLDPSGVVSELEPRHGVIARGGEEPVAANIDLVLIAHAVAEDDHLARLPRFLSLAASAGCDAAILITKADLLDDPAAAVERVRAAIAGAAPVLVVSAGEHVEGIDAVRALVGPGVTAALVGVSGAGKSTLVNALLGEDRQATAAVRSGDGRGRHTTVRRELVPLPGGGLLLDSPGVRLMPVAGHAEAGYGDLSALAEGCRFADCAHEAEPGCAVQAAIAAGEFDPERLEELRRLERQAEYYEMRGDPGLQRARNKRWRALNVTHKKDRF
jgi:ribosome biogenesis GTPase